jgi:hypothetical protein
MLGGQDHTAHNRSAVVCCGIDVVVVVCPVRSKIWLQTPDKKTFPGGIKAARQVLSGLAGKNGDADVALRGVELA